MSATPDAMGGDAMAEPSEPAADPSTQEPTMAPADVAVPAELDFSTTTLAGGQFEGSSLAGQDAILWIWASWCPICQSEAPAVAAASQQLPEGVTLYGLPGNSDLASSQEFVENYGLGDIEHIFSEDGSLWANFGVSYQPALVLIDDDGSIEVLPGATGEAGIVKVAQDLAAS